MPRGPRARRIAAVTLGVVAVCGCGSDEPESASERDAPGSAVARSRGWGEGETWTVSPRPRQVLGVRDGAAEYQFVDVTAGGRQSDGDLVIADAGSGSVRLYGADGRFRKTLGGRGSGPGEFRYPAQILVGAADSIFVWDDEEYRVTAFEAAGDLVGVSTFSREKIARAMAPPKYPGSARLLGSGELLVRIVEKSEALPAGDRFRAGSGALRVSRDQSVVETVTLFGDVEQVVLDSPWGPLPVTPPLARHTSIAIQRDGPRVCIGDQEGPEVRCYDGDGPATAMRWASRPATAEASEVLEWRERTLDLYELKLPRDDARRLIAQMPVPVLRPEYSEILLDAESNLWVRLGTNLGAASGAIEYLVFDPAGELLGSVSLPPIEVLEIGADYILGVAEDELEVQSVQVFGIIKPAANQISPPVSSEPGSTGPGFRSSLSQMTPATMNTAPIH